MAIEQFIVCDRIFIKFYRFSHVVEEVFFPAHQDLSSLTQVIEK